MKRLYRKEKYGTKNEWLLARGIGGSSASALIDKNPYQTKLDVYCAITNPKLKEEDEGNERTRYGQALEPLLRNNIKQLFASKYRVQNPNGFTMYRRIDKPFMTATVDGLMTSLTDPKERWIIEIKTHFMGDAEDRANWENHNIPDNYLIQCIHYLAVMPDITGVLFVAKLCYMNYETNEPYEEKIIYLKITRNDYAKLIADLEEVETNFWENNIVKRIPPSISLSIMEEK